MNVLYEKYRYYRLGTSLAFCLKAGLRRAAVRCIGELLIAITLYFPLDNLSRISIY